MPVLHDRQVTGRVPRLAGTRWRDVAPYLERFLRDLNGANDASQTTLVTLSGAASASADSPLSPRRPFPHRHQATDVTGLEESFLRRRPTPHVHRADEVVDLSGNTQLILQAQVFGG